MLYEEERYERILSWILIIREYLQCLNKMINENAVMFLDGLWENQKIKELNDLFISLMIMDLLK